MKVIKSQKAHKDIKNIFEYIAYDSLYYAKKTIDYIYSYINKLEHFPYIGRYIPEFNNKRYREIIYKKYRIFYCVSKKNNEVYIYRVIYSSRKIESNLNLFK